MLLPSTLALISIFLLCLAYRWNQTGTQSSLLAFQLLEFPLLLTFTQLVELPLLTEAVHQLQRPRDTFQQITRVYYLALILSFFLQPFRSSISWFNKPVISSRLAAVAEGTHLIRRESFLCNW